MNRQGSRLFSFSSFSFALVIRHTEVSVQLSSADSFPEALSFPGSLQRGKGSLQQSHPSLSLTRILYAATSLRQTPSTDTAIYTQSQVLWQKARVLVPYSSILTSGGGEGKKPAQQAQINCSSKIHQLKTEAIF